MTKKDLELMFELGCLRFIPRVWKQFLGPNYANLAEHHLRVAWLALLLAKMEKRGDTGKIVKMAMVHDVPESRTGDAHYISRQYTQRDEHKAAKDIFSGTLLGKEMLSLLKEYEQRQSIESKIVKDADFLDVDFEIREQEALGVKYVKVWKSNRKIIYNKFYTASAKKLWRSLQAADPAGWLLHARNRFNDGDMKPAKQIKK